MRRRIVFLTKMNHLLKFFLILALISSFFFTGCAVKTPKNKIFDLRTIPDEYTINDILTNGPCKSPVNGLEKTKITNQKIEMPKSGENNSYGIGITKELELAYNTYMGGDGEKALNALEVAGKNSDKPDFLWQVSFLRAQILIMMGRIADAEEELIVTSKREVKVFGTNINTLALRGEIKVWLEDFDGAKNDFASVLASVKSWSLPVSYPMPPNNVPKLVYSTTAILRAMTGLSGIYIFLEDYKSALNWAMEAEKRYNDVFFVSNHFLYGKFINIHADSYYGRAMNLVFLASAKMGITGNEAESSKIYEEAEKFFKAIGYLRGEVIVAALKARTYNVSGRYDLCNNAGKHAIDLALKYGMTDMIWRIEVLRGKTFLKLLAYDEAEAAFRRAQAALNDVSGSLSTDSAKVRFGAGKDDIPYYLSKINLRNRNFSKLFSDLEESRARAFVDMLAWSKLSQNRETELVKKIKATDKKIIIQRLKKLSFDADVNQNKLIDKKLVNERRTLVNQLRVKDPELADVLSISTKSLKEVQSKLKNGETLVYTLPLKKDDKIKLLIISNKKKIIKTLPISAGKLEEKIGKFLKVSKIPLNDNDTKRGLILKKKADIIKGYSVDDNVLQMETSKSISSLLQIENISGKRTTYIVPSGPLNSIPWGALEIKSPFIILPNGGWLLRNPYSIKVNEKIVLAGDPNFGGNLPQLPGAKKEVLKLSKIYNKKPLIWNDATEDNIRREIKEGVKILHLATHAIFYEKKPLESSFFLTKNGKSFEVTAKDIFKNPLPAKLVILSACETGIGKVVSGNDSLGLSRSFYIGGTLSILSSLWAIDDEGTKTFMEIFHRNVKNGDYGLAWLAARNHLKKLNYPPSVYGAFVLGGARWIK